MATVDPCGPSTPHNDVGEPSSGCPTPNSRTESLPVVPFLPFSLDRRSLLGSCITCCALRDKDILTSGVDDTDDSLNPWRTRWKSMLFRLMKRVEVDEEAEILHCLTGILAGERVTQDLAALYRRNRAVFFLFVPQIANLMSHGNEPNRSSLREAVHSLASQDIILCHNLWWYIRSSVGALEEGGYLGVDEMHQLQLQIEEVGRQSYKGLMILADESQLYKQFLRTPDFVDSLTLISKNLVSIDWREKELRNVELRLQLDSLNKMLPADVYIPVLNNLNMSFKHTLDEVFENHRVLSIPVEEAFCLHSKDRAPFHLCIEVEVSEKNSYREDSYLENNSRRRRHTMLDLWTNSLGNGSISDESTSRVVDSNDCARNTGNETTLKRGSFPAKPIDPFEIYGITEPSSEYRCDVPDNDKNFSPHNTQPSRGHRESFLDPETDLLMVSQVPDPMESFVHSQRRLSLSPKSLVRSNSDPHIDIAEDEEDNFELTPEEEMFFERVKNKGGARGIFGQMTWEQVQERVRASSPFGDMQGWKLVSVIVKSGVAFRQELLAAQLLGWFQRLWVRSNSKLWVKPFHVMPTSHDAGLIETIPDAISIDSLKKTFPGFLSINDYFERTYPHARMLEKAKLNYVASMAAYSIICYVLSIRDRHNGNILIDAEGHVIHVDFGYMLSNAPGNVRFEPPVFKLTSELLDVMDGPRSPLFRKFRSRVVRGFMCVKREIENLVGIVEMMLVGEENVSLPCFQSGRRAVLQSIHERIPLDMSDSDFRNYVHTLVDSSIDNWRSKWYDKYQRVFTGIM